jgi:hypothetical protein
VQSIETKILGPTDRSGKRIRARSSQGVHVTIPYKGSISDDENHARAAAELMTKLGWEGEMVAGSSPRGDGYVFVFTEGTPRIKRKK